MIEQVKPRERRLLIDLVREAGIDVSDWSNFKGGSAKASVNPKYCYEWVFVGTGFILLNLWFDNIIEREGVLKQELNLRERAGRSTSPTKSGIWKRRAAATERAVALAFQRNWPVRVVVCDGVRRDATDPTAKASKVERRLLDEELWTVETFDERTGDCVLARGMLSGRYRDQFDNQNNCDGPDTREISGRIFVRKNEVRQYALRRARGFCEWCRAPGFLTLDGRIYLETHHVRPLNEGGHDVVENVVALCPNHHREAHHSKNALLMRQRLLDVARSDRPMTSSANTRPAPPAG
jgi:5-methylcytosine-specific restriction protein A